MALSPSRPSPAASTPFDKSSSRDSVPYYSAMAPSSSGSSPQGPAIDHRDYTDADIAILHNIVTRAEAILSELTPSSRLPTHALFKAYDEVLPEYGIDPDDDQHLSKIVFLVGGVKNANSLQEKFRTAMSRLGVTLQMDQPQIPGSDAGDAYANSAYTSDGFSVASDAVGAGIVPRRGPHPQPPKITNGGYAESTTDEASGEWIASEDREGRDYDEFGGDAFNGDAAANLSRIEQHLESSAIAFRKKHHNKFSTVATFRYWQKRSSFIDNLCGQFEAARQADLEEEAEAKLEAWRAIAAEVDVVPLEAIPSNVYSKRIEDIAVRAHEIHVAKTAFRRWRVCARGESRKPRRTGEDSEDPFERVAAKAHKNLMLSRAFVKWSNRLEEESKKAQMATQVYEQNLKSKAFGVRRPLDEVACADEARNAPSGAPPTGPAVSSDAPRIIPNHDDPESNIPSVQPTAPPSLAIRPRQDDTPEAPAESNVAAGDDGGDPDDEVDEKTLLARRHILRMRFYDAWERYTADNVNRVRSFKSEQQEQRIAHTIPIWRSQAEHVSQEQEVLRLNAERVNYCHNAGRMLHTWRQRIQEDVQGQDELLESYAARANFYYKATKCLPFWRGETGQVFKQQEILKLYADRANYYHSATKVLPIWRMQTQKVTEYEEQRLVRYARRANYYYRARTTLLTWHRLAKQRRKERLKDAHLETRRLVKKGMGLRCIAQWREKLQPSLERYDTMDAILEDVFADQEWRRTADAFGAWHETAQQRDEMNLMSDTMVKEKVLGRWRGRSAHHRRARAEAMEHWKQVAVPRALKNWNLRSLQVPNRPVMVANALEKRDRRLVRASFDSWHSLAVDNLVPVELSGGGYGGVNQIIIDARHQASLNRARGLLDHWRMAAARNRRETTQEEVYAPTPGRPHIFLGTLGSRETTTPLAPVPSRTWRASETATRGLGPGARASRIGRTGRNLRVSWAQ
ncbi:hypothetical protein GGS23DRAFT_114616 [Durotheca rogersii]|uniref:uncharacterized protein n=1 Tax=Durotheca rogersii TaxID=419775 RepID=UPI002220D680|nr:uncharacterized protein GGS23DRAFT_114616 [Durotheca rogersii]KAI5862249.1 hypothetical protein GGS23DRAFT_114616 [Durotheca rogersii]